MIPQEYILISAPNVAGEQFMKQLSRREIPFAAIVNNKADFERLNEWGVANRIAVDTTQVHTWAVPELAIGKVFLFEKSLNLCCRYIQICRAWTSKPIYVITGSHNPRLIYKGLGANHVIHSNSGDVAFLIQDLI
ncbi:hypothetical protein [Cohnella nanjingensis]|uniref:RCK N-terminal domain-containing protein n=1 Tax=Cohnella nanjingensis TaxID=1387779 RepID=A0A7X0RLM1_9BACL|nr:hypothetical protein [Cohnella nanjingensis]MBB6669762.1 hypothetical protein [Cohnella nanjingensis]